MNQSTRYLVGAVVLILVIIAGWWLYSSQNSGSMMAADTSATSTDSATPSGPGPSTPAKSTPVTFKSLLTQTGNYECKYEQVSDAVRGTNVVDMAGGKMFGQFRTTDSSGKTEASLLVYDGHYLYTWKEGMTVGTKTVLSSLSQLPKTIPADLTSGAILGSADENVSWDCSAWNTDATKLVPPSYVTFTSR